MVKDRPVKRLARFLRRGTTLGLASARANKDAKTARRYRPLQKLPRVAAAAHLWRTRADPLAPVWPQVHGPLQAAAG